MGILTTYSTIALLLN